MTIESQNQKTYRPSMLVCCGIDTTASMITVTPADRYGSGLYDENMRAGRRGVSIKLMDLAGGGFPLDGTRHPIRSTPEADDGDTTIVDSYKGFVKYGIPAATASSADGTTSTIGFSLKNVPSGTSILTAHLRDSEGECFRLTASNATNLQAAIRAVKITPGRRLYIDRITAGKSWQWDKTGLVSCGLVLRGVETKGNNPELQMSEVEIKGVIPKMDAAAIADMDENSPIWYAAGYHDEVTPVRRFYLSEGIKTENVVATVKGYDATKFLEAEHRGVISMFSHSGFSKGNYLRSVARRCYGILGRGLIYDHKAEYAREAAVLVKGEKSNDSEVRYMSEDGVPRRSMVAAHCNIMRISSGGLNGTGAYCDYVDAGLPTMRAGQKPIGKTKFGHEWTLSYGEVSDFAEEAEVAIAEISAKVAWPKPESDDKGKVKTTSFYAETLSQGDSRLIDTEEPYTAHKFKNYDKVVKGESDDKKQYIHSKIGDFYRVNGHYYPDKGTFGRSAFQYRITALKTAKQRLIGIRNILTQPANLSGLPNGVSYEDGTVTYKTGKKGEKVTFPDVFHGTMEQAASVSGKKASGSRSMWGDMLKQIGDRSNIRYTFKYRGNPKMQPRDIIHMVIDGQTVDMTIDNLTLEHAAGGLISSIECRKGII